MFEGHRVTAIIPAYNEEASVGRVLAEIPTFVDRVIVCDNGSTDNTAEAASAAGAEVVSEATRGYGAACLRAVAAVDPETEILLFLDGDYSDYPEQAERLLTPITQDNVQLVIGTRMVNPDSRAVLTPVAQFGNWLSTFLIRLFWGYRFSDLGPFRAITFSAYRQLRMADRDFGWTVEMQIKAAKQHLRAVEVPVSYRPRIGASKVSGTLMGSVRAGVKILYLIARELFRR